MKYLKSPAGKLIQGLAADTPAAEAASKVLRIRLRAVEQMLPLAVERAGESPEFVHQLRVSTRRADAALRTLKACLPRSLQRKTRKRLRNIRRSATAARECDVHVEHFRERREEAEGEARAVFDDLILWTRAQREDAQHAVEAAAAKYPARKLRAARHKVLDAIREPESSEHGEGTVTLADIARGNLPPLVEAMREAAAADLHVLENLHELRIRGKRLRYALEIFGPCYDGGLRTGYDRVTALQTELGTINDLSEIIHRIEAFTRSAAEDASPQRRAALEAILADYRAQVAAARRAAVAEWERGAWTAALDALEAGIGVHAAPPAREAAS